ncbi:MAG: type II toxin-antitoxin system ParD family antitoxin [Rhodobacter sp.]|jgi:antitoxin ParD1/3/4|nr:type II toxin-antitoxin system ParD family antitoxin [Rhodobacter sp.]MCA3503868.1 type II toxin-antitoxin system ParD family antitoxin [Rhodobacter sp.]
MTIKSSISLTDEQHAFVRDLVDAGRFSSVSAVLQQGVDLLKQKMHDDDLQRRALQALLEQRSTGRFVTAAEMDRTVAGMIAAKRRAHAVQN